MLWNQIAQEAVTIGWDFYGPVLLFWCCSPSRFRSGPPSLPAP